MKMTLDKKYLAIDIGASSGRAVLGCYDGKSLSIEELYRFVNEPVEIQGSLHWDYVMLMKNVIKSLNSCSEKGHNLDGIGVDSIVDFGLVAEDGSLAHPLSCYRSDITKNVVEFINSKISKQDFYNIVGIPARRVGVLAQLIALKKQGTIDFSKIKCLLQIPDLIRYCLCGKVASEVTIASLAQLMDINNCSWSSPILKEFDLPEHIFMEIVQPGSICGSLKKGIEEECGLKQTDVITVAGHDTASAAVSIPFLDDETVFISSGTWSVVGQLYDKPNLSNYARDNNFVNEYGFEKILCVRDLTGLFLFENYFRSLSQNGNSLTYEKLIELAKKAEKFKVFVDTNASCFFSNEATLTKLNDYLTETGQEIISDVGQVVLALFEGLVFSYLDTINKIEKLSGNKIKRVCVVGGGSKNEFLNQMIADATGLEVVAGPTEAAIIGNISLQLLAQKQLNSLDEIRDLIKRSFSLKKYVPKEHSIWKQSFTKYMKFARK